MMNIFEFMNHSPILSLCICYMLTVTPLKIARGIIRHLNIKAKGWPPAHVDADGEFKEEINQEE